MFFGVGLFNLFNLLYHFFMVRNLSPKDYGHLNALMAFFMLFSVPSSTIQTTVTKFVSKFYVECEYRKIRFFLRHFILVIGSFALFLLILIIIGNKFFSYFLQIPFNEVIFFVGIIIFFILLIPIPWGVLQGLQRFGHLSINMILNGGLKLALGIIFVLKGFGVTGAVGAISISYIITLFFSVFLLEYFLRKKINIVCIPKNTNVKYDFSVQEIYWHLFPIGTAFLCFMILTQMDIILVKHFFSPIEAGYYSIAQIVGKIILFLPLPIIIVMFPKVSSLESQGMGSKHILINSLIAGVILCVIVINISYFFPELLSKILIGKIYFECIPLMKLFSIGMTLYSLNFIIINYHLATFKNKFLFPLIFLTLMQVTIIVLFHETMIKILYTIIFIGFLLLLINLYLVFGFTKKEAVINRDIN